MRRRLRCNKVRAGSLTKVRAGSLTLVGIVACMSASPAHAVVCSASSQSVAFGSYDTLNSSALDGVGSISVTCDATASFTISLSTGAGTYSARKMVSGTDALTYNLYSDSSRLLVWGDGSGSTTTVTAVAASGTFTVYGRIPARQNVPAASYSDTITVTVSY